MISEQLPEEEDVLLGIIGISSHLPKLCNVRFVREVVVDTERYREDVIDGEVYVGTYTLQVGWTIPLDEITRGEKRKPCRLNTLRAMRVPGRWVIEFIDVPEDSYEMDREIE